jgi:hypothetical protein
LYHKTAAPRADVTLANSNCETLITALLFKPSHFGDKNTMDKQTADEIPWVSALTTYFGYAVLTLFGHMRDWGGRVTGSWGTSRYFGDRGGASKKVSLRIPRPFHSHILGIKTYHDVILFYRTLPTSFHHPQLPQGYAPLLNDWEFFYTRRLYHRIQDAWNRPIAGPPMANRMSVAKRVSYDGNYTMQCVLRMYLYMQLRTHNIRIPGKATFLQAQWKDQAVY